MNADFQNGFADEPDGVASNVALCIATGVAGLSIEDAAADAAPRFTISSWQSSASAPARAAIDASGLPVVLTARCEAWLVGEPDASRVARERLIAFAEAGADCLYAPGVRDLAEKSRRS